MLSFRAANKFFPSILHFKIAAESLLCASTERKQNKTAQHCFRMEFTIYIVCDKNGVRKGSEKGKLWKEKPSVNFRDLINIF